MPSCPGRASAQRERRSGTQGPILRCAHDNALRTSFAGSRVSIRSEKTPRFCRPGHESGVGVVMAGIAIRGLSKSFGARDASFAAVADLDLDIADNSFVTLLGPSGCGKTTTLRLIAGYIVPDKGTIEVDGKV